MYSPPPLPGPWRSSPQWARAFALSRSHHHTDAPQSVGLLWTTDQPDEQTPTWQHTTLARETSMPPAGFELAILASERPQTQAVDRAATGIDVTGNSEILYPTSFRSVFSQYLRVLRSVVFLKSRDTSKAVAAHTFECKLQKQELRGQLTPCACWRSFAPNYRWLASVVHQQHLLL
jgi:hypothetical protein